MADLNNAVTLSRDDQFLNISIYEFENSDVAGLFSNNRYGENIVFDNIISMIMIIEDCMNKNAFPQPMSNYRKLEIEEAEHPIKKKRSDDIGIRIPRLDIPKEWESGKPLRTFRARIIFRTISGWQGEIQCVDSGEELRFKSDMEFLMFIIDNLNPEKREETA